MVILGTDAEHNTTQRVRSGQSCTMASCSGQGISNADKVLSVPAAGIRGTAEKEGDILNAQRSVLDNLCKVTLAQLDIVHGGLWHSCDCINFPGVLSFVPGNLCLREGYEYCGQKREFMSWVDIVTICRPAGVQSCDRVLGGVCELTIQGYELWRQDRIKLVRKKDQATCSDPAAIELQKNQASHQDIDNHDTKKFSLSSLMPTGEVRDGVFVGGDFTVWYCSFMGNQNCFSDKD